MLNDGGGSAAPSPRRRRRKNRNRPITGVTIINDRSGQPGGRSTSITNGRESYWVPTPSSENRQLRRLAKKVGDPYVMSQFLDQVNFQHTQNMLDRYKDQLFETDTSNTERPEIGLPDTQQLRELANKVNDPYVMSKFLGNINYNRIAGNTAWEKDRLYEDKNSKDSPSHLSAGRLIDPEKETLAKQPGVTITKGTKTGVDIINDRRGQLAHDEERYGQRMDGKKPLSGDKKPYLGKVPSDVMDQLSDDVKTEVAKGIPMKQFADGKYYVMSYDEDKDEDVYVPVKAFYDGLLKESGKQPEQKESKPKVASLGWLTDKIGDAAGEVKDAADAVIPEPIENTAKAIGGGMKQSASEAINFIERPLYSKNAADKYISDHTDKDGNYTGSNSGLLKAIADGLKGKSHTTGGEVFHSKIEQDKRRGNLSENTFLDNPVVQATGGMITDSMGDPINFIGGEVISGPARVLRGLAKSRETIVAGEAAEGLRATSQAVAKTKVPRDLFEGLPGDSKYLTADEIFDLVGGNTRKFSVARERAEAGQNIADTLGKLEQHVRSKVPDTRATKAHIQKQRALQELAADIRAQRDATATTVQVDSFVDDLATEGARLGEGSPSTFLNIHNVLAQSEIETAIKSDFARRFRDENKYLFKNVQDKYPNQEAWLKEHASFEDSLRHVWDANPHLAETVPLEGLLKRAEKGLKQDNPVIFDDVKYKTALETAASVNREYKRAKEVYDVAYKAQESGEAISRARKSMQAAQKKRDLLYAEIDKAKAKAVLSHAHESVVARSEGRAYIPKDVQRADDLDEVRNLLNERATMNDTYNIGVKPEGSEDRPFNLDDFDITTPAGREELFSPHPEFLNYEDQLRAIGEAVRKAEKSNTSLLGSGLNLRELHIPDGLRDPVGNPDLAKIQQAISIDDKNNAFAHINQGESFIGREFTDEEKQFLNTLAEHVNKAGSNRYARLLDRAQRPIQDITAQRTKVRSKGYLLEEALDKYSAQSPHVSQRTAHKAAHSLIDRGMLRRTENGNKWVVRRNGKTILVPDPNDYQKLEKLIKDAGIEIPAAAKRGSKTFTDSIKQIRSGKVSVEEDLIPDLIKRLRDSGMAPPDGAKLFAQWAQSRTEVELTNALRPERLAFNLWFKQTHKIDFADALDTAKRAYNRAESDVKFADRGKWAEIHTKGVTEREFMREVSGSKSQIRDMLFGSPFKITLSKEFDRKGFEALRQSLADFGKVDGRYDMAKVKTWFDQLFKLKDEHPAEYQRIMTSTWNKQVKNKRRLYVGTKGPADPYASEDFLSRVDEAKAAREAETKARAEVEYNPKIDKQAIFAQAMHETHAKLGEDLSFAKELQPSYRVPKRISGKEDFLAAEKSAKDALKAETKAKKDALEAAKAEAKTPDEIKALDAQLENLRVQYKEHEAAIVKSRKRAILARQATIQSLREQALAQLIATPVEAQRGGIGINFAGKTHVLGLPTASDLGNGAARKAGDWILKASAKVRAATFEAPVASLEHELQAVFHRASNHPDQVIRIHWDSLNKNLGHVLPADREKLFDLYKRGQAISDPDLAGAVKYVDDELNSMVPLFKNQHKVNGSAISYQEIARWLPRALQIAPGMYGKYIPETGNGLIKMFTKAAKYPDEASKITKDPLLFLWHLRVATEKALGYKYAVENLNTLFGVKRYYHLGNKGKGLKFIAKSEAEIARSKFVEKYKDLGWETISRLDDTHYFPKEIVPDINKMLDLMEPRSIETFTKMADKVINMFKMNPGLGATLTRDSGRLADSAMRGFDKTTRAWKASATVPNPGYYTRNLLGEIIAGWFGGVNDPSYYTRAKDVLRYMNGDAKELEAIMTNAPWANYVKDAPVTGGKAIAESLHGHKLTIEDAAVLYYDQALKTGFLNTERHAAATQIGIGKGIIAASPVGKGWQGLRSFGETVEDLPRIAHFLHAVEHAPARLRTIEDIAEYAASQVRRYHFDYSDVSNFEKAVMVRVFPFYKWTRKAIPMLISSLFLKPGKVAAVPKSMTFMSDLSNDDWLTDGHPNGFMPTFTGVTPNFIQDLWAYKGPRDSQGKNSYINLATPQTDILKVLASPSRGASGLLNPLIKVPMELGTGETVDMGSNDSYPVGSIKSELARQTPVTNFLSKVLDGNRKDGAILEPNDVTSDPRTWLGKLDETTISFLTGLGVYEDFNHITEPHDPSQPIVID